MERLKKNIVILSVVLMIVFISVLSASLSMPRQYDAGYTEAVMALSSAQPEITEEPAVITETEETKEPAAQTETVETEEPAAQTETVEAEEPAAQVITTETTEPAAQSDTAETSLTKEDSGFASLNDGIAEVSSCRCQ